MTKRQALKTIIFISIFILILTTLTYMIRTNGEVKDLFNGFYAQEENTLDVIMIGSSPVYPFYSAPKLWGEQGITCYPLSSHVQRPSAALPLLKEAYKTQKPEVVVFEMRMYTMEDGDMENNMAYARGVTDNMKYSLNRIYAINRLVSDVSERYTYYFDIFKYHSNWKTIVLPDQIACFKYEKPHPLMGFVIKDEVGPLEEEQIPDCADLTGKTSIPAEQEERLYELLNYLKEQNQQALFIVSPYRIEPKEQEMYNYMRPIIESYGYDFVNMNEFYEEIGIDFTTDYYDYGGHVNTLGAEKCTAYLGKLLEQFHIGDKREEEGYESWEQAYELYLEKKEQALAAINKRIENKDFAQK